MQDAPQIWKSDSEQERPKDVARSALRAPVAYRVTSTLFAMLLAMVLVMAVAANPGTQYPYEWLRLLVCAVGGIAIAFLLMKLVSLLPAPTKVGETVMAVVLMAALVGLQLYVASTLKLEPGDTTRWGTVIESAQNYVLYGEQPGEHFLYFPWDGGAYTLLCGFFGLLRIFGLKSFSFAAVVLNIAAIDAAVWLMYRAARGVFGGSKALFMLGSMLLFAPLYLYIPIPTAQTLVLPFVAAQVLLWQRARKSWRAGDAGKSMGMYCFASALAALGALIHVASAFVWIAVSLDLLLMLRGRGRMRMLLSGMALAVVVFVGGFAAIRYGSLLPHYNYADGGLPASYWVYSGLGVGEESYAADLADIIAQPNKASRQAFVQQGISRRTGEMGFSGMLRHTGKKMAYTYGDGTFGAPAYLKDASSSFLLRFVTPGDSRFEILAYYSFVWQAAVLFWAMVSGIKSFLRKNDYYSYARVAILLYMVYMLVVQASPQDVLPILPLLLLCALEAGPIRSSANDAAKEKNEVKIPVPDEDFEDVVHPVDRPEGSLYDQPAAAQAAAQRGTQAPTHTAQQQAAYAAQSRPQPQAASPSPAPVSGAGYGTASASPPTPGYAAAQGRASAQTPDYTPTPTSGAGYGAASAAPATPGYVAAQAPTQGYSEPAPGYTTSSAATAQGRAPAQTPGYTHAPAQSYAAAQGYETSQARHAAAQSAAAAQGYEASGTSRYASAQAAPPARGYGPRYTAAQTVPPAQGRAPTQTPGYASAPAQSYAPAQGYETSGPSGYALQAAPPVQAYGAAQASGYGAAPASGAAYSSTPDYAKDAWPGQSSSPYQTQGQAPARPGTVSQNTDDWMRRTPPPRDTENWMRTPVPRRRQERRNPDSQYRMPPDEEE